MNRPQLLVATCSLVALVATGWWLLQRPAEVAPGTAPAGTVAAAPRAAGPATAAEPTPQPTAAPTATERTVAETAAAPAAAGRAGTRRLEGSIVVVDGVDGSRHPNCDGLLGLELRVPVDADATTFRLDAVTVPVVAGRWQADVTRAATRLQIGDTVLDQRVAVCLDDFELADVQMPLLLRALWPRGAMLRVTGADTKAVTCQVRGTLQLSPDWGADIHLELEPGGATRAWTKSKVQLRLDQMQGIGAGRHQWGEVTLLAGRWEITVHGTGYRTIAEVGPGQPAELHIVVPEPNEVRVRVVDATTGVPIPGATPSWHGSVAGWSSGWSHSRMQAVGDDWYRTLAPAGTIVLSAHAEGYSWSHAEHEVRAGANTFVLRVPRVCGIELVLKDGEVTIPWPDNAYAQIEHTTAKSGVDYWSDNRVAAQQPGEHLLTLEPIPGYEPIPPRKVQIEPEQWTRVEIALRRKP